MYIEHSYGRLLKRPGSEKAELFETSKSDVRFLLTKRNCKVRSVHGFVSISGPKLLWTVGCGRGRIRIMRPKLTLILLIKGFAGCRLASCFAGAEKRPQTRERCSLS